MNNNIIYLWNVAQNLHVLFVVSCILYDHLNDNLLGVNMCWPLFILSYLIFITALWNRCSSVSQLRFPPSLKFSELGSSGGQMRIQIQGTTRLAFILIHHAGYWRTVHWQNTTLNIEIQKRATASVDGRSGKTRMDWRVGEASRKRWPFSWAWKEG